jgi:hypothetical protein
LDVVCIARNIFIRFGRVFFIQMGLRVNAREDLDLFVDCLSRVSANPPLAHIKCLKLQLPNIVWWPLEKMPRLNDLRGKG